MEKPAPDGRKTKNPMVVELCLPFQQDDCRSDLPAAGNRNGSSLNNYGENGNYWSGTLNSSNTDNAQNLNFNSSNHNTNWNYRKNGRSVRPVSELIDAMEGVASFRLTRERLLCDLYKAYRDARRHKRRKPYQMEFEMDMENNLVALRDELFYRTYKPRPCECFIIHSSKKREVFASHFRDRVVHHLYYNYTSQLFERVFINDSYSCRVGRGTHYGIHRLAAQIEEATEHYKRACYVMKLDIKGYFMHIDRQKLLCITLSRLLEMAHRGAYCKKKWNEWIDYSFLAWLSQIIIMNDPVRGCIKKGCPADWSGLPPSRSLFCSPAGCGLPIGNLTSQLFSNVYMNEFDQYVVHTLACKYYGRYVDDSFVLSESKANLHNIERQASHFLLSNLALQLNPQKTDIRSTSYGVEFLGAYVKPYRIYVSRQSLRRMRQKVRKLKEVSVPQSLMASVNSYLGVLSHYRTYNIRYKWFGCWKHLYKYGFFTRGYLSYGLKGIHDLAWPPADSFSSQALPRKE